MQNYGGGAGRQAGGCTRQLLAPPQLNCNPSPTVPSWHRRAGARPLAELHPQVHVAQLGQAHAQDLSVGTLDREEEWACGADALACEGG